jgi:hypothetical protein
VVRNDSVLRSPYSPVTSPTTPELMKTTDASLEAKRAQVLAAVMNPTEAPLPAAPPPDPPTWDIDSPVPTPYAASHNQPPLPPPQFALGAVNNPNVSTPYAAPPDQQHTVAALKQSPVPMSGSVSPYAGNRIQQAMRPAAKPSGTTVDALSPYAEVPTQSVTTHLVQSPAAPASEKVSTQPSETKKETETSSPKTEATKTETDSHIQQTSSSRELNFREIHEVPATSGPDVDLDWTNDSSGGALNSSMKGKPDDPPLVTAMRCFMSKRPVEAITWLKRYDEPNQELLMRFLPLLVRMPERDLTRADVDKATAILEDLNNLFGFPAEGDLAISKLCLCKHIKTFGDYEPFPEDHQFQPKDLVWIYAEVRNFTCRRRDMGNGELFYETQLSTSARITNYDGTREWPLQFDRRYALDQSRSLRRDYWDNLSFNVPDLPPGGYTLWLKVEDEPTHRFKERAVDFQVVPSNRGS